MSFLILLVTVLGTATAAPQVVPAVRRYQPLAYSAPYVPAPLGYRPVSEYAPVSAPVFRNVVPAIPANIDPDAVIPAPVLKTVKPYVPLASGYPYTQQAGYVRPVAIIRHSQDSNFDGSFNYDFESEDGIASSASGFLRNPGTEAEAQVMQGQYSYTAPDGTPVVTRWFADETGFHAEGAHIPVPPADPYRST